MTRIKSPPVEDHELLQWLTAWRSNRELAFSAMPDAVYSYFIQERYIDHDWDITVHGHVYARKLADVAGPKQSGTGRAHLGMGKIPPRKGLV